MRDFIDFTVMAEGLGLRKSFMALKRIDKLYPQENNAQVSLQLLTMLSDPSPFDLDDFSLVNFKNLKIEWQDWNKIKEHCQSLSHYLSKNRILDKTPK